MLSQQISIQGMKHLGNGLVVETFEHGASWFFLEC